ncbi:uncharacterized protein LOC6549785 [Drosophila erecta]|uniref:Uncharacterized protein n=1 Tax=Drosophila erecta TaxID=7220 RepID=B3NY29_DROER|nr:uncharacterized protein LOC6549785 [Drosophila erecta]EDV47550.1 uncharacterized protein Dere_GG19692 [Drosophila erecta]
MAEKWNPNAKPTENMEFLMTAEDLDQQSESSQFSESSSLIAIASETSSVVDRMLEELNSIQSDGESLDGFDIESQRLQQEIHGYLDLQIAKSEQECIRLDFLRCIMLAIRDQLQATSMQNM